MSASFDSAEDQVWTINIQIRAISEILADDADFVRVIADAVRAQLLKDVRGLGNLYGPTAAQARTPLASQPQVPGTIRLT